MVDRILKHLEIKKGTKAQFDALPVKSPDTLYFITDSCSSGRNIGDIFYTTRFDSSLGGAVECNGGTYSTADYTGTGSIGELLRTGKIPYVPLADYEDHLRDHNGICGAFGWDGGTTTTFRVPLLKDIFIEAAPLSEQQHGWHVFPGLPNITGSHSNGYGSYMSKTSSGAFSWSGWAGVQARGEGGGGENVVNIDASRSSSIYGRSNTVQPEAVKYRAMVQLFNGTTDQAVATVGTVVAEVANRVIKGHEVIAFQAPTAENGYTWYRLYADGWVEQGGKVSQGRETKTHNLLIAMSDSEYYINLQQQGSATQYGYGTMVLSKTTTTFAVYSNEPGNSTMCWEVKGMAA